MVIVSLGLYEALNRSNVDVEPFFTIKFTVEIPWEFPYYC